MRLTVAAALALTLVPSACGDPTVAPLTTVPLTTVPLTTVPLTTVPLTTVVTAPTPPTSEPGTTEIPLLPQGRVEVIRWVETGGCMVFGPNCPTWTVYSDGTVEVSRTPTAPATDTSVQATGSVDVVLLEAVVRESRSTDMATLVDQLGPGSCQSCVDGSDIVVTIDDGDRSTTLDSLEVAFDPGHPLFDALLTLSTALRSVELPVISAP